MTTDVQTYSMTFDMTEDTDLAARLEFNVGLSTAGVQIGNVRVEQTPREALDPNATKPTLGDGNHVYNGIQLSEGREYVLRFKAKSERIKSLQVGLNSLDGDAYLPLQDVGLTRDFQSIEIPFTMGQETDLFSQLQFVLGSAKGEITLDDVQLLDVTPVEVDLSPLKNGSFTEGLTQWGSYVHFDAQAAVEAVNKAAQLSITQEGQEPWSVLMEQGGLELHAGQTYVVRFDASSTVARNMEVTIENAAYTRYLSEIVQVTPEAKSYEFELTMGQTDMTALKFLLGRTDGSPIGAHDVTIDNVSVTTK
ncbi:carbohydrate binding domain-containing protein [Exiguobacterium sp. s146]|uniref:carbohydrate binding domain-containing protein n=1 Tax=Exiguobacterium sp. s146 TaxID=2751223 RepID=UPI00203689FB|nr:carbohydrate binding domain-containing protein [Exiguobacterium sp. s146]